MTIKKHITEITTGIKIVFDTIEMINLFQPILRNYNIHFAKDVVITTEGEVVEIKTISIDTSLMLDSSDYNKLYDGIISNNISEVLTLAMNQITKECDILHLHSIEFLYTGAAKVKIRYYKETK